MALYEFFCNECQKNFDVRCSMNESGKKHLCPEGHSDVKRIYSVPAIKIQTPQEAAARRYGGKKRENMMKEVREKREIRKRDSNSSDQDRQSNELWTPQKKNEKK